MSETIRKTVHYAGRVQGVGFRQSVARVAEAHSILGTVRNLSDGRVKLVAEAPHHSLSQFLDDVSEVMDGYIESSEVTDSMATGEFDRFTIGL